MSAAAATPGDERGGSEPTPGRSEGFSAKSFSAGQSGSGQLGPGQLGPGQSAAGQSAAGGAAAGASGGGEASKPVTTDELLHPAEDAAFFEGWVAVRDNGRVSLLCAELSRLAYAPFTKIAAETRRIGLRDATPIGGPGKRAR
ncbi:MAG: hypothetical protein ACKOGA_24140, partial [Planctomycetaceae bacterium]